MTQLIATILLVMNQQQIPLINSHTVEWLLKNDKTERPDVGKTESRIERDQNHVLMKGLLASLPASIGRVGFSLMETEVQKSLAGSEGIIFTGRGTEKAVFSVLVKDHQWNQPDGTLTFQWDFETHGRQQHFFARWDQFTPTIRGKKVSGFKLDLSAVQSLSFQISRSHQKYWYETDPLEFEWEM
jgi:hypothetical protein